MRTVSITLLMIGIVTAVAMASPASSMQVRGVQVELRLNKANYELGETVEITLSLNNQGAETATFQFSTGQMYDFVVLREGQRIWQWSHGRAFTQAFTTLTLKAGERKVFAEQWNQRGTGGQQVASGTYEMMAVFPAGGLRIPAPVGPEGPRVSFTIAPRSAGQVPLVASRSLTIAGGTVGELLVNGRPALRIRAAAGGFSPAQRAGIIATRLRRFIAAGLQPEELAVVRTGQEAAIMWRSQLVVTADANHARLSKTTPLRLAMTWHQLLVQRLSAVR